MLKGTSLPRRKNGSEAWLKENAKGLRSKTEVSLVENSRLQNVKTFLSDFRFVD